MFLGLVAQRRLVESFEGWDEVAKTFVPGAFVGRIEIADRFLSNFNKPLRRRMLFTAPDVVFPASRTFRHPGTGDVYLIGQSRQDATAGGGNPHIMLTVCHLVTEEPNGSSGLATLYRKAPAGPGTDPGWLVETVLGQAYMDIEFRTSASEPETHEVRVQNFFGFLPRHVECQPWDFVELQGKRFRVVDTFADSGLAGLRVDQEEDHRVNFVFHLKGARTYNRTTHEYEESGTTANVTGHLVREREFPSWSSTATPYLDVVIERSHIGFQPVPDDTEVEYEGRRRVVRHVSMQAGDQQYLLRCE